MKSSAGSCGRTWNALPGDGAVTSRKAAFAPVVSPGTRVLILGSLPGDASLAAGQYYASPRNRFWDLVGAVIDQSELPALPYVDRLEVLLGAGIGLWDAVSSAERPGSLDSAIRAVQPAAVAELAASLPQLVAVACNGKASSKVARPLLAQSGLAVLDLPSSSPAHAAMAFAQKREMWLPLRQFLGSALAFTGQ